MMKSALRRHIRWQKEKYQANFAAWSMELCQKVLATSCWEEAHTVLLYHALPDEPDLQTLLDAGLTEGKTVLLPVVAGDDLLLKRYTGADFLREGAFHILEPTGADYPLDYYADIGLALVPGMAFDRQGHRLGRGRGYYDRLLLFLPRAHRLGICFPFQLLDAVPCEPHDISVHEVLCPKKTTFN